jgi:hypothetical protein
MNANQKSFFGLVAVAAVAISCSSAGSALARGELQDRGSGYEVDVIVDGRHAPTFRHGGETYVMGMVGERYVLRVYNRSSRRVEAVVTVDGLDVVDGKTGSFNKRGYLVPAWGSVDIDGWRMSNRQVAAFRFSSVGASYAGRTGQARNVGVIGVAIFPERVHRRPQPIAKPRPYWENRRYRGGGYDEEAPMGGLGSDKRKSAGPPASAQAEAAEPSAEDSAGSSAARSRRSSPSHRPGLGTEFGERHGSQVHEVAFVRASASHPAVVLGVRYDDADGLHAMGIDVYHHDRYWSETELRQTARPFPVSTRRYARPPSGWDGR